MYQIYITTNDVNDKVYVGCHTCTKRCIPKCKYLGSGIKFKEALKEIGRHHFTKRVLKTFDKFEDAQKYEKELICEHINNCYNTNISGTSQFPLTRKKIGESNKGHFRTEKQREKIRKATKDAMKNIPHEKLAYWEGKRNVKHSEWARKIIRCECGKRVTQIHYTRHVLSNHTKWHKK